MKRYAVGSEIPHTFIKEPFVGFLATYCYLEVGGSVKIPENKNNTVVNSQLPALESQRGVFPGSEKYSQGRPKAPPLSQQTQGEASAS